jgi:hypothetical protein
LAKVADSYRAVLATVRQVSVHLLADVRLVPIQQLVGILVQVYASVADSIDGDRLAGVCWDY